MQFCSGQHISYPGYGFRDLSEEFLMVENYLFEF
jgi:hypothetical protein